MRLYAVADIHAKPERLDRIQSAVKKYSPDLLVMAGDICNYVQPRAVFSRLNALTVPVLAIRGNSDLAWHERTLDRYSRIRSLHLQKIELQGCEFVGVSGTVPVPFRTRLRLFEKRLTASVAQLVSPTTILVVHPPPFGTLDRVLGRFNAGSRSVARIISSHRPRMVICGHIHEDPGMEWVGPTLVINCSIAQGGNGAMVDFDPVEPATAPAVEML
ncbi:MAG: metallophosphoesterase family protein [Desulfatitalea sp.]|nr:metallophosphoesterase family protein [Desulfatitalea sp.]